jgi:site-specific DNA recombinase
MTLAASKTRRAKAHRTNANPLDLLKIEQERISRELDHVEARLAALELRFDVVEQSLKAAL